MGRTTFFEEGDYFLFCTATPLKNGKWEGSVLLERKSDHTGEMVPGMRHIIRHAHFELESDAITQAHLLAIGLIKHGRVGLE